MPEANGPHPLQIQKLGRLATKYDSSICNGGVSFTLAEESRLTYKSHVKDADSTISEHLMAWDTAA